MITAATPMMIPNVVKKDLILLSFNPSHAIDKMVEFVTEFTEIERLCILQHTTRTTDHTRMLQDLLALEFARLQSPVLLYDPLTASWLGPDAMGMVILEGE